MALALDGVLIAALAREWTDRLGGARLRALRLDHGRRSVALVFREGTLRLGLDPERGSVLWSDPVDPDPSDRPLAARLVRAHALPDDRVLILSLARVRGSQPDVDLVVEWISNRWNAVVTEGPERTVRAALVDRSGERAPRIGHPWVPPGPSSRAGMDGTLSLDRWRDLLLAHPPEARRRALLAEVAWTSPINVGWILGPAGREETAPPDAARALDAGHGLWQALAGVALGQRPVEPALVPTARGAQPYPLVPPGLSVEPSASLMEAFARAAPADGQDEARAVPTALLDALTERAVRAWVRADALRRELAESPDPQALRAVGDLVLARLGTIPRGVERARVEDFSGTPVDVPLDPRLGPKENAADYYERAGRAARARERLPDLVTEAETEARRIEALVAEARSGKVDEATLRAELPAGTATGREPQTPTLPYRVYRSSGGIEIRVGRGARHNDDLTFHHSAPGDVWLHARHAAGAHVVLRWRGEGNPPARDLAEAAALAALHSKGRSSGTVPVDWTRRKYVRKPRHSPAGQVVVERAKTLFVTPDPNLEDRLRV